MTYGTVDLSDHPRAQLIISNLSPGDHLQTTSRAINLLGQCSTAQRLLLMGFLSLFPTKQFTNEPMNIKFTGSSGKQDHKVAQSSTAFNQTSKLASKSTLKDSMVLSTFIISALNKTQRRERMTNKLSHSGVIGTSTNRKFLWLTGR